MDQTTQQGNRQGVRQRRRWWRLYVHKGQKRHAIFVGVLVFVYSFLVFFLSVIVPYVDPAGASLSETAFSDRAVYAIKFLVFGQTVWPAFACILFPAAIISSLYVTHRIAGPLYRIEQCVGELGQGNLALRIRLRAGDELQELAESLNGVISNVEQALTGIRDHEAVERKALRQCLDAMRVNPQSDQRLISQVEMALKEGEHIDSGLNRFRFSNPQSQ